MSGWNQEKVEWYSNKIAQLVEESSTCNQERFNEIAVEVTNYQSEINRIKGL